MRDYLSGSSSVICYLLGKEETLSSTVYIQHESGMEVRRIAARHYLPMWSNRFMDVDMFQLVLLAADIRIWSKSYRTAVLLKSEILKIAVTDFFCL